MQIGQTELWDSQEDSKDGGDLDIFDVAKYSALDLNIGPQQMKILLMLTKGYTNNKISKHLSISPSTTRYHISAIFKKLGVSNRTEAAAEAIRNNLVEKSLL